ncbi:daf-10 [Pristionchus pacificus]|nr:daf-10 [Pristionchus pacificus]
MRPNMLWMENFTGTAEGTSTCVYAIAWKPDGSEILVAVGQNIFIFCATEFINLQTLKGHKDTVYALAWSHDGSKFASGSADKSVIIWTSEHEGILKYTHSDAIQCMTFHPSGLILLSCALTDYAHWSESDKNVNKQKVSGRITACAWSRKGEYFLVALFDGRILLKTFDPADLPNFNASESTIVIERPGQEPIWSILFNYLVEWDWRKQRENGTNSKEFIVVADWARTVSYYGLDGKKLQEKKDDLVLDFDPTCMVWINNDEYLVICGSNCQVQVYTKLGTYLGSVVTMDTWVWIIEPRPKMNQIALGCVDGTFCGYTLFFSTVHALYRDIYTHRNEMTDVTIQHLPSNTNVRIRCNDLVKKVAIYKNKLAVQLSNKTVIYTLVATTNEREPMEYRLVDTVERDLDCSLLVVCALHIITCNEKVLTCYDHKGLKEREWRLPSLVRYIKVVGGPTGKETLVVGVRNGMIYKIFVDNPFPVVQFTHNIAVRQFDVSIDRRIIGIVDENNIGTVVDLKTKETIFQDTRVGSIAVNAQLPSIVCYCGNGRLFIRAGSEIPFVQRMQIDAFVVGFTGNRVYCLHMYMMRGVEVPYSTQLYQYIESGRFGEAYKVACMGVTEEDWRFLANESFDKLDLTIAHKAYSRVKDYRALDVIHQVQGMTKSNSDGILIRAKILAYNQRFETVAELYKKHGYEHEAMQLFTDLRMFDDAQALMHSTTGETQKSLIRKRANWARDSNEPRLAAEMFIASGDYEKAVNLLIEYDWIDVAIIMMGKLDRNDKDLFLKLGDYLTSKKEYGMATSIYTQLNEMKRLVHMHINANNWNDAFAIANRYPGLSEYVYLEYGRYLAQNDQFEEATQAFHKAGSDSEAYQVIESLATNSVMEGRFTDAAYFYWQQAKQFAERAHRQNDSKYLMKSTEIMKMAEVYYAYDGINLAHNQLFTPLMSESLLHKARFIAAYPKVLKNISMGIVYFFIANVAQEVGAFKLARKGLEKIKSLYVHSNMQRAIDVATLKIRSKRISDDPSLNPKCFVCNLTNGLDGGSICIHCGTETIYCFSSFENLPVVEFFVDEGISEEEAEILIESEPPLTQNPLNPFEKLKRGEKARLDRDKLSQLDGSCVLISNRIGSFPIRYFFNVIPSISVSICPQCNHMFHSDDYEMCLLSTGTCPFCRYRRPTKTNTNQESFMSL